MYTQRIGKFQVTGVVIVLLLLSIGFTYLIATQGIVAGPLIIVGLIGIFLIAGILVDYKIGFYAVLTMGMFMFYVDRIIHIPIPLGVVYDALGLLVFLALFINRERLDWTGFKHPIMILFLVITIYQVLQFFNPSAVSHAGWLFSQRNNLAFLLFIVCFHMFKTLGHVRTFTITWLVFATIVALYGIFQEVFGLTDFEWAWVNETPERLGLYQIWGRLRKFSMLSDPSIFGLFMAFSCLACAVLAMGPFKTIYKLGFFALSGVMFMSMSFSGTRTAMAMVAVGVAFFIVMTLHDKRTIIAAGGLAFILVALMLGPFYGGTINRIRSTFNPSEDPSMAVRDNKRVQLQQYVLTHPIGGGLSTTGKNGLRYSAGHYLAGGWDPDSGYLFTALEMGWIGLILFQVFFFIVMLTGIRNYFSINDPLLKTMILTYMVPFLALSVAHFTQDALFTKPVNVIVIATYAIIMRIPSYEKKLFSVDLI